MYSSIFRNKQLKDKNQNLIKMITCGLGRKLGEQKWKGNLHFSDVVLSFYSRTMRFMQFKKTNINCKINKARPKSQKWTETS